MKLYRGPVKHNWRLCRKPILKERQNSWGSGVTGEMDALERMPSFLGLPILERSASLFFSAEFSFLLSLSFYSCWQSKVSDGKQQTNVIFACLRSHGQSLAIKISTEIISKRCKKTRWCNNIKACNEYYAMQSNGMFCKRIGSMRRQ